MGKEALATKYRPKRFADVVEQDVTKAILTEQLENKTFKNCLLFCGGAGTGKAQPLNSKVLTPKGFVKMCKVKIGMEVITGDYNTALISGVFPQGKREIYKIYLSNGDTIQVSDEHINIIYTENKEGKFEESTMLTKDLINIDYTNLFMRKIVGNGLFNAYYSISDIKFVGLKKCQCILVDAPEHTYITDNYIVTHNTTSARIFANEVNGFKGKTIEIDAASNNSVEHARNIIEQAQTQALDSEYKVFVLDECVTGDTEILTDKGWKRIDSLTNLDSVAQYNNGNIEFIKDYEYINKYYEGDMYKVYFRNGKYSILMSPHHVQPVRMKQSGKIVERYITDCKFTQKNEIIVSGSGTGNNNELTAIDRLYIACQADGYYCNRTDEWELHLSIPRKKQRAIQLLNESGIKYKISGSTDMDKKEPVSIRFRHKFPISKKLSDYFNVSMGVDRASDFISEILLWDGSVKSGYPGYYSCADKDNVDFVASILAQCNCSATQKCTHYDNPNHKDIYSVSWYYKNLRTSQAVSKECIHDWKGNIYCVKVPSHMIIVRAEGFTVVTGNCHMLSNAAWNALLKLVEEPPKKSLLLFCLDENGLVHTKDAIKRVKDVQSGEYIWTGDSFHQVSNVYNNGQQECLKITLSNGVCIKCTPNHKIKVLNGTSEVWKLASELTTDDVVAVYHSHSNFNDIANLTDTECWFLGYLTGNGSYNNHAMALYTPEYKLDFVHAKLDTAIKEGWIDHYEEVRFNGSHTTQIHFPYGTLRTWYAKTGCDCEYTRGTKSIPTCVYQMSTHQLEIFVQGWFDADGVGFGKQFLTDRPHPQLSCASTKMVMDLQQLLIAHGFDVRVYHRVMHDSPLPDGRTYHGEHHTYTLYLCHQSGYFHSTELEDWLYAHRLKGSEPYVRDAFGLQDGKRRVNPTMIYDSKLIDLQGNKWYQNIESIEPCGVCNVYDLEVPDVHEFIYNGIKVHNCTTDPHKIPDTILSRVQRYNFQKISQDGIVSRLKYIIEQENKENVDNPITYEESALEHIAKTADGGMRDSITLLDKAIGYNNNLTLNNVLEALGSVNYDTMFELTDALNIMDKKKVVEVVESIHRSGLDLKQFIKQYTLFILDVCKYDLFREFTYLQLPNIYKEKLDSYDDNAYIFFNQLLGEVSTLSNNLRYESMPKPVVEATFLQLCTEA